MFKGSNVALITPFKDNGLDEEAYIKLIHFHMDNGTSGLVPAGTTGESPTLNHNEHQRVIDLCIKESQPCMSRSVSPYMYLLLPCRYYIPNISLSVFP